MRVLITGATGFVGAHATAVFAAAGHEVIALHHGPRDDGLIGDITRWATNQPIFLRANVVDGAAIDRILRDHAPSHVLHAAAITPTPELERNEPRRVVETNELGTLNLLLAAARHGVSRFLQLSSTAIYAGLGGDRDIDERSPHCDQCGLYATTKLAAERLCLWANQTLQLDLVIVRLGSVYGQFERPTQSRAAMSWIYQAIRLAAAGETVRCNAPNAIRDWLHGDDAGAALLRLMAIGELPHFVYNLAGPRHSMGEIVSQLKLLMPSLQADWVESPELANLPISASANRCAVSTARLHHDAGFVPTVDLRTGLGRCAAGFRTASSGHRLES